MVSIKFVNPARGALDIQLASVVGPMTRFYDDYITQFSLGGLPMRFWIRVLGGCTLTLMTALGALVPLEPISAGAMDDFVLFQDETKKDQTKKDDAPTKKGDASPKKDDAPAKKGDAAAKKGDATKDGDPKKGTGDTTTKKKPNGVKKDKPEVPKNPFVKLNTVTGKVGKFDEASNCLTIKVPVPYINNKNIESKDVDVKAILTDDVKIRIMVPPPQYDEKGRPKRYTTKELNELKGEDKKSPGFPGSVEDLQANAVVRVDLVRTKEDLNKLRRNKKDDPANELDRTNLVIVVTPGPPQ